MAQHDQLREGERRAAWLASVPGEAAETVRALASLRLWPTRFGWRLEIQYGPLTSRRRYAHQDDAHEAYEWLRLDLLGWQAEVGRAWWSERGGFNDTGPDLAWLTAGGQGVE